MQSIARYARRASGLSSSMRSYLGKTSPRTFATLVEKERGEEATYFAKSDAEAKAALKASIAELVDTDAETTAELSEFVEKKKKEAAGEVGITDWKFALPIGLFLAIPALGHEIIVLNEETQLVACFVLFCSTMYTQIGGMVATSLDEGSDAIKKQMEEVDDSMLVDIKSSIDDNEKLLTLDKDVSSMHALMDDMAAADAEAKNFESKHQLKSMIQAKLDNLVALEDQATNAIRMKMLGDVKANVLKTFTDDKKAKDATLDAAIKVLAGGTGAPKGKDLVGAEFMKQLKGYSDAYTKLKPGEDPILAQLEKDIAAVCTAPTIEGGGNVYDSIKA